MTLSWHYTWRTCIYRMILLRSLS